MRRAAAAILVLAACAEKSDDELRAPDPEPTTTTASTATTLPENGLADGFYPVQVVVPEGCPDDVEGFPSRAGDACYVLTLTDVVPMREVVESAEPRLDDIGQWVIELTFTDDGIDRFNELAALCFGGVDTERCPTAQVAIAAAGAVVSAPSIQEPSFQRDQIQITGDFTLDEATELAESFAP